MFDSSPCSEDKLTKKREQFKKCKTNGVIQEFPKNFHQIKPSEPYPSHRGHANKSRITKLNFLIIRFYKRVPKKKELFSSQSERNPRFRFQGQLKEIVRIENQKP